MMHLFLKFLDPMNNTIPNFLLTCILIFVYLYSLTVLFNGHSLSKIDFTYKMNHSDKH